MDEPLLTYEHVEISYDGVPVVHDVSFTLAPDEILGLVGESGSGKSTLVKAAMGLLGPYGSVTRGDIWFEGRNLPDLGTKELSTLCGPEIAMVFQDSLAALTPVRTIGDQFFEQLSAHRRLSRKEAAAIACERLAALSLRDPERVCASYPFQLSGGIGQRVGIAMAMAMEPKVLLADEPTSALDAVTQKQVIGELQELRETHGTAIVLVTHNIGVVRALADSVLVLKDGETMEQGLASDVLVNPTSPYTRELLDAAPALISRGGEPR